MIELTGLNGETFILNSSLIETMSKIPETKITLTNGKYHLVKEEQDIVLEKIIAYNRRLFQGLIRIK